MLLILYILDMDIMELISACWLNAIIYVNTIVCFVDFIFIGKIATGALSHNM